MSERMTPEQLAAIRGKLDAHREVWGPNGLLGDERVILALLDELEAVTKERDDGVWIVVDRAFGGDEIVGVYDSATSVRAVFPLLWKGDEKDGRLFASVPHERWPRDYAATLYGIHTT